MKETILVTGGAGFIGSHVTDALLKSGRKVVVFDNFNSYYDPKRKHANLLEASSNRDFFLVKGSIEDALLVGRMFSEHKIDKIVHLAARAGVRPSIQDPQLYAGTNLNGLINLLEAARTHNVKNFIFGSSSSVYGNTTNPPFSEDDAATKPISPYAATKRAGELLCYTYSQLYELNVTCLRFFTVYGPRGRPDMAPYLFTEAIFKDREISIYGDGSSARDYTYVADIVQGILSALDKEFRYEIINLGNSMPVNIKDFISVIEKTIGKKGKVRLSSRVKGDVELTFADITKAQKLLSYRPTTPIDKGMEEFFKWYTSNVA